MRIGVKVSEMDRYRSVDVPRGKICHNSSFYEKIRIFFTKNSEKNTRFQETIKFSKKSENAIS